IVVFLSFNNNFFFASFFLGCFQKCFVILLMNTMKKEHFYLMLQLIFIGLMANELKNGVQNHKVLIWVTILYIKKSYIIIIVEQEFFIFSMGIIGNLQIQFLMTVFTIN